MNTLQELLQCVSSLARPRVWESSITQIEEENRHLRRLMNKKGSIIYGLNTLVGHRDNEHVDIHNLSIQQEDILNTHAIGHPPYYSQYTARCITYAKLYAWSAGRSGVSPTLHNSVAELASSSDFYPKIPTCCSYSSGDVIPAAHWANEILSILKEKKHYTVHPGEVMALINGSFVHIGFAASLINKLRKCWSLFVISSAIVATGTKANWSNFCFFSTSERSWSHKSIEYIKSTSGKEHTIKNVQDPISIRAIPQVIDALCNSIESFMQEINYSIFKPSGNPLVNLDSEHAISQANFMLPVLSIKTESVIESILFAMWSIVGRINFWLSGNVDGVPRDGSNPQSVLGLIQYPKLMMAKLENARMHHGRRVFASGSQTSYGTEDLWSNGLFVTSQLESLLDTFFEMCAYELHIAIYLYKHQYFEPVTGIELLKNCSQYENIENLKENIEKYISDGGLKDIHQIFPIKF